MWLINDACALQNHVLAFRTLYACKSGLCKAVLDGATCLATGDEDSTVTHRGRITPGKRNMKTFILRLLATSFCRKFSLVFSFAVKYYSFREWDYRTWQATVSPWWTYIAAKWEATKQFLLCRLTAKLLGWKYWIGYWYWPISACIHQTIGISVKTHISATLNYGRTATFFDTKWSWHLHRWSYSTMLAHQRLMYSTG